MTAPPISRLGKVLHFPGKIHKVLAGQAVVPSLLEVHPTQLCNQSCPHCVGGDGEKASGEATLTFDEFKRHVHDPFEELSFPGEEDAKRLSFSGDSGDPLVCRDVFQMLDYTRIPFIVVTNGYRKPDPVMLKAEGIRVSIDAGDGESYARAHGVKDGPAALERVHRHVRQLMEWKASFRVDTSIGIGHLTHAGTGLPELERAIAMAEELGVDYINFRPLHHDRNALGAERAALSQRPSRVQVLFADKYDRMNSEGDAVDSACYATQFLMVVAADLSVYSCCHFTGRADYSLGSLRDRPLRELILEGQRQAGRYPNAHCVPHCRGHRINLDVARVAARDRFDPYL